MRALTRFTRPSKADEVTLQDEPLLQLGRALRASGYRFITVTPETHRRVNERPSSEVARSVRDVFGWSRPFTPEVLPRHLFSLLERAEMLEYLTNGWLRSLVRFSSLGEGLYLHDAYPTLGEDSVFFGPDTYRFAALLARVPGKFQRAVDLGCGSGAGGLSMGARVGSLVLSDVSTRALRFSRINAALNEAPQVEFLASDGLRGIPGGVDLVMANPPYLVDERSRTYRHGGGSYGIELSVRFTREALERLSPGGTFVLYSGAPVVDGEDQLRAALLPFITRPGVQAHYEELDPDVFSEELENRPYANVERLAVVSLVATRST
ncbi:methyltransferase [Stigmatella aurantiaca]|uniref:Methyltransferase n=1 Tax=Stigmatella aurantiaca (strain DW4/3-1) TaxID=378806 RepID=Q09DE4_STIAD|nr:class I SAM-dependent methyltransferase [Stigmatella aurantiaca]ADO69367.1 Methyltransferase [Stigmatella aurantiaca DW4/3-1]EAU69759.1 methyltransferase small [Stigmatella aurantiaca DW4/3-1]